MSLPTDRPRFRVLACSLAGASMLTLAAGAASVLAPTDERDWSRIPPTHAEVEAALRGTGVDLATAIATAVEAVVADGPAGVVRSAAFDMESDPLAIEVDVHRQGTRQRVTVAAATGEVLGIETIERFPGRGVTGDWQESPTGLKWYDVVVGDGDLVESDNAVVEVHYTGWLVDGTKIDSSRDAGQPARLPVDGFIPGWTEGLKSMRVGGVRKLIIPPSLAFGGVGSPPVVPPDATLVFDIEILDKIDYSTMPEELPGVAVEGDPVTTESGLMYYDIVEGDGESPADENAIVRVRYTGWLNDGTQFDASPRGEWSEFPLGGVIPGWTEGLASMKVGGKRKLVIPFEIAYGSRGRPPRIPPRALLVFDVELLGILNQ